MHILSLPNLTTAFIISTLFSLTLAVPIWPYASITTISISTLPPNLPNQPYTYILNFPSHKSCISSSNNLSASPYLSAFISPPCSGLVTKFHCDDRRTGGLPPGVSGVYVVVELVREGAQCVMQAVSESTGLEIGKTRCVQKKGVCLVDLVLRDTRERIISKGDSVGMDRVGV